MKDIDAVSLDENIENEYIGLGTEDEVELPGYSQEESYVMKSMNSLENRRVMLVNTVVGPGNSVGRLVAGLYDTLLQHGYDCLVAYGRGECPAYMKSYRIGRDIDMYIHGAVTRLRDRHGFASTKATREFINIIEEFDPDIIHLHNIHGYYLNVKVLFEYLKTSGRRIIWTLHDCWSFTGHCSHFEYVGCMKWSTANGCSKCEQLEEYPRSFGYDNSEKNFSQKKELFTGIDNLTVVTPSEWLKARVQQSFLKEYHIVVVPTGIDLTQFRPIEEELDRDNVIFKLKNALSLRGKKIILGVANPWRDRKGLMQFITLNKTISDKYAIVLLGLNDEQAGDLPETMIPLAKTESMDELAALYSMADVYVNLTLEDTFPTTNLEALACGTPVVTFKTGGSPESIDETCGIAVEKNSIQGIVAALDKIELSKGQAFTREQCVLRAMQYDKENRFMEYIQEVYEGI
ncbi:MAG: glycosyltransferase [Lachnospiraceae bacterium]|nr:glycosyltransferase [Lachnospiraceae bacterium]